MAESKYYFPNRKVAPIFRLEYVEKMDPKLGDPLELIKTIDQRMVGVQELNPGVVVEIATKFGKDCRPTEWVTAVLKPGEAIRLAQELMATAVRAMEWVTYHKDEALAEWADLQKFLQKEIKKDK